MTKSPKKPRCVKAAKRALKALSKPSVQQRVSRVQQRSPIEEQEEEIGYHRQARREDTKRRNADAQELPRSKRLKQTNPPSPSESMDAFEYDKQGTVVQFLAIPTSLLI
jgi:hypothetical protein